MGNPGSFRSGNAHCVDGKTGEISGKLFHWRSELELAVHIRLTPDAPEVVVELDASGPMQDAVAFPGPIVTSAGQLLILPVNQGISYPVDDATLPPMDYHLYGGHGLCMAWWGVTDLTAGLMAIVETPDDAHVGIPRIDGLLTLARDGYRKRAVRLSPQATLCGV